MADEAQPGLSEAYVRKVAKLSRLALSDAEVTAARSSLTAVLGYVERLRGLDLAGVEPMAHVGWDTSAANRLGDDTPGGELSVETVMAMAPASSPPFILAPKVLGDGGGA